GSKDGLYHRLAIQVKAVLEANHPDLIIELRTSAGSSDNIARLDGNQAQLALVQNDALGGESVRSVAALYPEVLHLLCRTNAGIRSLHDLAGKRVGIGAAGSGTEQIVTNLLAFANVADGANQIRASFSASLRQLRGGELDAAFFLTGLGAPAIGEALTDPQLALAPIHVNPRDDAPAEIQARTFTEGFRVHYPHVSPQTIPLMTYKGRPTAPMPSMGVQAVQVCQKNVDADIMERITRTLFEQRAVLSQKEPVFSDLNEEAAQADLQFPLHIGAENYYLRNEPGFLRIYAELIALAITVILLVWSALTWTRSWYEQHRKNRIDTYYQAVEDIICRLHDGTDFKEIDELENELLKIRQRASAELVKEQLAADESYIIYQNMLNGCQAMLVRMRQKIQTSLEKDA
ncbi:MAG: TAXI family TRAP transporter solute-binding subunit, partial [Anaerolineales bacterium]|nr:TAXI family TRAP transporter solute-binding subunit [Anaerolineales bacterium]